VENVVEVRYAGVGIGRSTVLRDWSAAGAFIGFAEPMPTGTPLVLLGEGIEQAARVAEVIESANLAVAGMRVEFVSGAQAARPAPAPAASAPPASGPTSASPAVAAPAPAPAVAAPAAGVASPEPVEPPSAAATVAPTNVSGAASPPHPNEGEAGSSAGSGKRRRRRR